MVFGTINGKQLPTIIGSPNQEYPPIVGPPNQGFLESGRRFPSELRTPVFNASDENGMRRLLALPTCVLLFTLIMPSAPAQADTQTDKKVRALMATLSTTKQLLAQFGLASEDLENDKEFGPDSPLAAVEAHLSRLGLLEARFVGGPANAKTRRALCAWRELTGRKITRNFPTAADEEAILTTTLESLKPTKTMTVGLNVNVACQALFWVEKEENGRKRLEAVMPVSTGDGDTPTRLGDFRIFASRNSWHESSLFPMGYMYRPLYFSGGMSFHGTIYDKEMDGRPESMGCVRMLNEDIDRLWKAKVGYGTNVKVYGKWNPQVNDPKRPDRLPDKTSTETDSSNEAVSTGPSELPALPGPIVETDKP